MAQTRDLHVTLRQRVLAAVAPRLTNGQLAVLCEMSGDLTARQWAQHFQTTLLEIERAEFWLGVKCQIG